MQIILLTDICNALGYGKYAGTYKIATELRMAGFTCQTIDNYTWLGIDKLKVLFRKFITAETIMLGVSCTLNEKRTPEHAIQFWGITDSEFTELVNYAKSINPNIKVCIGGSRVSATTDFPDVDYVIYGKAENAIIQLMKHLQYGEDIKLSKNEYSAVIRGDDYFYTQEQFITSKIQYEHNDIILPNEALSVEVARGCIFQCSFCFFDLIGKKPGDWTKTGDTLYDEFMRNYEMFGTTDYLFSDELINESIEKMEMLCEVSKRLPFKLRYSAYGRLDMIWRYPEMRELFLESGAQGVIFGIETLSKKAGKNIGKGLGPNKVKDTLEFLKETWRDKIVMSSGFIIGLPGETEEDIIETVDYLSSGNCPLDVYTFTPLGLRDDSAGRPTNKMTANPSKYGITIFDEKKISNGHDNDTVSNWSNGDLSAAEVMALYNKIVDLPNIRNRFKHTWTGRIAALGYTNQEIFDLIQTSDRDKANTDIFQKTLKRKQEYYQRLLDI
jgi:hypothetical protein